jgi:hypothetical protein
VLILYICFSAIVLINGLIGIFARSFDANIRRSKSQHKKKKSIGDKPGNKPVVDEPDKIPAKSTPTVSSCLGTVHEVILFKVCQNGLYLPQGY